MNNTAEWALEKAEQAEQAGDFTKAIEYQEIAETSIIEKTPMEIPSGLTGYFVTAEKRKETILQ